MTHRIRPCFRRDFDLPLGDQRPRDRGAEQINPFIKRIGAKHREDIVANEFLAQILDINILDAEQFRLAPRRFKLLPLAEVGGKGHHLAAIGFLQPFQDDRCIEPA